MKYDSQLGELRNVLPTAKNILIAIPANADTDKLAAALSLFLILESLGKEVNVVSEDTIRVSQANLFGVDHIQKTLPTTDGGNLTITLEGVAASDKTVPALEKLDWFAENNNLNLVFHVLPGQTFQPARIVPHYQGSGFNLIFVVGAVNLNALGALYSQNQDAFSGTHIVNIDTQVANTNFGQTNVIDSNASSLSEVMSNLIVDIGYNLDADSASNLLAGIFEATSNLTNPRANADTYMVVANCLRVGGRKPAVTQPVVSQPISSQPTQPSYDWSALMPKDSPSAPAPAPINVSPMPQPVSSVADYALPPVVPTNSQPQSVTADAGDDSQPAPSQEERPYEEGVISETVEPEWLTPKIFKGSSLG